MCLVAYLVEGYVYRCHIDIGNVHGHLGYSILLDVPAYGLAALQCSGNPDRIAICILHHLAGDGITFPLLASFLTHVESHGVGTAGGCGVEIVVYGYKEIPCPHCGSSCTGGVVIDHCRSEIGFDPVLKSLGQTLILAAAAYRQIPAFLCVGCILIAEYGDTELLAYPFGKAAGILHALLHSHACDRHERAHIGSAHTGMLTVMMPHVDNLGGLLHCTESGFHNFLRLAYKSHDCTVGGRTRVHIEEPYSLNALRSVSDLFDNLHIASFAEIGDAFDKFTCHVVLLFLFDYFPIQYYGVYQLRCEAVRYKFV